MSESTECRSDIAGESEFDAYEKGSADHGSACIDCEDFVSAVFAKTDSGIVPRENCDQV